MNGYLRLAQLERTLRKLNFHTSDPLWWENNAKLKELSHFGALIAAYWDSPSRDQFTNFLEKKLKDLTPSQMATRRTLDVFLRKQTRMFELRTRNSPHTSDLIEDFLGVCANDNYDDSCGYVAAMNQDCVFAVDQAYTKTVKLWHTFMGALKQTARSLNPTGNDFLQRDRAERAARFFSDPDVVQLANDVEQDSSLRILADAPSTLYSEPLLTELVDCMTYLRSRGQESQCGAIDACFAEPKKDIGFDYSQLFSDLRRDAKE